MSLRPADLVEWILALAIAAVALAFFLNGSFFSTWNSFHIDLAINLVAADALKHGVDPYGPATLLDRATALGSPTLFTYSQLFTSYIQPPTSALSLLPLTTLGWRDATHLYLLLEHVLLAACVLVTLLTVRPTVRAPWVIAGVAVILMGYAQIYASFALDQVDTTICLLLVVGFWGYVRGHAPVTGATIACAAAIKLIPGLLLLYFLWRREYRIVLWGAGAGLALLAVSFLYVGYDVYHTYFTDTLPALLKGSTYYSNVSVGALIARAHTPDLLGNIPELESLTEVPDSNVARLVSLVVTLTALASVAFVLGSRPPSRIASSRLALILDERPERGDKVVGRLLLEYYLVVTVLLMISSVTWEFYCIWLLPLFLGVFLAPGRVFGDIDKVYRIALLIAFAVAFVGLNYPGDKYLFEPNGFFYHPDWVTGVWAEKQIGLYRHHLDLITPLRLLAMALVAGLCSLLILQRRAESATKDHLVEARQRAATTR